MLTKIKLQVNDPSLKGLLLNITYFVGLTLFVNGLIFGLGWDVSSDEAAIYEPYIKPSGLFIGMVWILLILLLSIARWHLNKFENTLIFVARTWITALILMCISYPFYSIAVNGLFGIFGGLIGNVLIIAIAFHTINLLSKISILSLLLTAPILIWVPLATTIIISELGIFRNLF